MRRVTRQSIDEIFDQERCRSACTEKPCAYIRHIFGLSIKSCVYLQTPSGIFEASTLHVSFVTNIEVLSFQF